MSKQYPDFPVPCFFFRSNTNPVSSCIVTRSVLVFSPRNKFSVSNQKEQPDAKSCSGLHLSFWCYVAPMFVNIVGLWETRTNKWSWKSNKIRASPLVSSNLHECSLVSNCARMRKFLWMLHGVCVHVIHSNQLTLQGCLGHQKLGNFLRRSWSHRDPNLQ